MEHDRSARALVYAALSLLPLAACEQGGGGAATPDRDILVGAHYYLWFPARFAGGSYLRANLLPHQQPLLGEYSSASPGIAEQHISWAAESGIDFFTLDFWPSAPERNAYIDKAFLASRNVAEIPLLHLLRAGGPRLRPGVRPDGLRRQGRRALPLRHGRDRLPLLLPSELPARR